MGAATRRVRKRTRPDRTKSECNASVERMRDVGQTTLLSSPFARYAYTHDAVTSTCVLYILYIIFYYFTVFFFLALYLAGNGLGRSMSHTETIVVF